MIEITGPASWIRRVRRFTRKHFGIDCDPCHHCQLIDDSKTSIHCIFTLQSFPASKLTQIVSGSGGALKLCQLQLRSISALGEFIYLHCSRCLESYQIPCLTVLLLDVNFIVKLKSSHVCPHSLMSINVSQAARQRKPCVNGDTSFLWESETF